MCVRILLACVKDASASRLTLFYFRKSFTQVGILTPPFFQRKNRCQYLHQSLRTSTSCHANSVSWLIINCWYNETDSIPAINFRACDFVLHLTSIKIWCKMHFFYLKSRCGFVLATYIAWNENILLQEIAAIILRLLCCAVAGCVCKHVHSILSACPRQKAKDAKAHLLGLGQVFLTNLNKQRFWKNIVLKWYPNLFSMAVYSS